MKLFRGKVFLSETLRIIHKFAFHSLKQLLINEITCAKIFSYLLNLLHYKKYLMIELLLLKINKIDILFIYFYKKI